MVKKKKTPNSKAQWKKLGILFGASILLSACNVEVRTSTEYLIEGNNFFKKRDYKNAEISYRKALEKSPNNPTAQNNLGVILNELGRYDESIDVLSTALKTDPKNPIAHYVIAKAYLMKKDLPKAMDEAKLAVELDKTDPIAWKTLGEVALAQSDNDTAASALQEALAIDDSNDATHHLLALALGGQGDFAGQVEEERKALSISAGSYEARLGLIKALMKLGKNDDALKELNELQEHHPENEELKELLQNKSK
ncbi:MAG: tetratricopeptide repeat protein [Cyanobacteria bacterium TGS_CYA1]|nr:tetratricopeptide repeat protein [Cyanobacteria bacterium TGS_CYA1]